MRIRDFTYPKVGLENHAVGHPFRFGVWIANEFYWVGNDDWNISMRYLLHTIVSKCIAANKKYANNLGG